MPEAGIKWEVSAGSLINLGAMVVAVAIAWSVMNERSKHTRESMDALTRTVNQEVITRRAGIETLEARIRALESAQARADERFNSVLQVLGRIEARLERIEGQR